jgi:phage gpG-like protein
MARGPFEIEIEGMADLLARFKGVEEGMLDFRQLGAWRAVASEFRKIEKEQFDSEGSKGESGKWKQLSPKYAIRKLAKWGDVPILQASGKLYRSLTQENAEGAVYEETAQELTLGTSIPYAAYHQRGGRVPQREPISLTREQKDRLMQPVQDKLRQLIANAKLRDLQGF